jgi:hypothetical protein
MVLVTIPYWYDDECRVYQYYRFGNTGKWDSDAYLCMRYLIMYVPVPIVRPVSLSLVPVPVVFEILYVYLRERLFKGTRAGVVPVLVRY